MCVCVYTCRCMDSIRLPFLSNFHVIAVLWCDAFLYFLHCLVVVSFFFLFVLCFVPLCDLAAVHNCACSFTFYRKEASLRLYGSYLEAIVKVRQGNTYIHMYNQQFLWIHTCTLYMCVYFVGVDFQSTEWLLEDEADSLQDESAAKAYEVH